MNKFIVVRCKKCGKVGIGETKNIHRYIYHCKVCNKRTKLKAKWGLGLPLIKSFDTGTEAEQFLKKLMDEIHNGEPLQYKTYTCQLPPPKFN